MSELQKKRVIHQSRGFSLIELMIVLAIVGILATVVVPSYRDYVNNSIRSSVQSYMLELASRESNYLQDRRAYTATVADLNVIAAEEVTDNYDVTITVDNDNKPTFIIKAVPKSTSPLSGDGTLTLNHLGTKTPIEKW